MAAQSKVQQPNAQQNARRPQPAQPTPQVVVTDVDISFGNMVMMMVKLSFAAIPAMIIIWSVFAIMGFLVMSIFGIGGALLGG